MTLQPGFLLNARYHIEEVIAQGGMGAIYRAFDTALQIKVAVKENFYTGEEHNRQFRREAVILADLRHPNLPRVTDHFTVSNQGQYLVMDFIEGDDLRQQLKARGRLDEADVIRIGVGVCQGLAYLHSRIPPIIHRDIKPGNVKVSPGGGVFLVDFGLAKLARSGQNTSTGAQALTPGYAPPEQYGQGTEPRSDIYALGATLYAALTGQVPEDGLMRALGTATLTPLQDLRPDITQICAQAIEKAMAVQPQDRFQTADEFRLALLGKPTEVKVDQNGSAWVAPLQASSDLRRSGTRKKPLRFSLIFGGLVTLAAIGIIFGFIILPGMNALPDLPQATRTRTLPAAVPARATNTVEAAFIPLPSATVHPSATFARSPTPLQPESTPSGGGEEIAFVSVRSGVPQIWGILPDGSSIRQITLLPDGACQPDWNPDHTRIVFISPCAAKQDIYDGASLFLINADGTGLVPLPTLPGGDFDPAWSPDGSRIAFTSLRDGRHGIYILTLSDNVAVRLSSPVNYERYPAWSPDGAQIAYQTTRPGFPQIWVMDAFGKEAREFSDPDRGRSLMPVWSPDLSIMLYVQGGSPTFLVSRQIDNPQAVEMRVSDDFIPAENPSFSPDGWWIAADSTVDQNEDIYILLRNGSSLTRLTDHPAADFDPDWD